MISTIHSNVGGTVVQAQHNATGVRVCDEKGNHIDLSYDEESGRWFIETSCPMAVVGVDRSTYTARKIL